ncbi:CopG family transcriptional regulator [Komagataeibacter oboediens]|uniref:CopG family transcriptional regulator n=1 Tax=Komagataeibacter oboediens TaxID=65958 RepID=A0ABS5SQW2_9PROT|nr:CopG family transcriptional regulator [Komagataeibacter oboediens]MBL7234184.1 CopG family transcriptional regulator [Komagataeibacter oboediens]MBT0676566.1 CopG family transcriptional regulator [Komagataeibacter oboediens]MBT0679845.1 CopG family transcriptional regulator [Komagataeibacter oboediens]
MKRVRRKQQITVYLDPVLAETLGDLATRRRQSQSMLVETALAAFLSPEDGKGEGALNRRLERLDRRIGHMERDLGINVETLALFIRFWLLTTPPLPEPTAAAARAQATARYEQFIETLARHLSTGHRLHQDLSGEQEVLS